MSTPSPPITITSVQNETECATAMQRLRQIKTETTVLQRQLNTLRQEQKHIMRLVGTFLTNTARESVRMGDLVVQAETKTIAPKVNIITSRQATAQQVLNELARVGVTMSVDQWKNMVQHMRTSQTRTRQNVRLLIN
jgi:hypothetical protein